MAARKPTLGYPSRTDAVRALLAEGKNASEIAHLLNCSVKTVSALRCAGKRHNTDRASDVQTVLFARALIAAGRAPAAARGLSVNELFRQIVETVLEERLVDAVLDDAPTGRDMVA